MRRTIPTRGFSLLEVLVVIMIIGMMSAIIVPSMGRTLVGMHLKTGARDVMNVLRIARETAIKEQAVTMVRVDFVKHVFKVTDEFGEARHEYELHKDVEIEAVRIEGTAVLKQEVVDIYFYPEGYATGAEVVLRTPQTENRVTLRTDSVTGTVQMLTDKDAQGR